MAFQVKVETIVQEDANDPETLSSKTYTGLTQAYRRQTTVDADADSGLLLLWNGDDNPLSAFTLCFLTTNSEVEVEFTTGESQGDEEYASYVLVPGHALFFGNNVSRRNHGADDAFAGTLDTLDLILVLETYGDTATVDLRLFA